MNGFIKKDQPFNFDAVYKKAFNKLKERLISVPLFAHFHLKQPLILETNALNSVITGIFSQKQLDGK